MGSREHSQEEKQGGEMIGGRRGLKNSLKGHHYAASEAGEGEQERGGIPQDTQS